jgi:hypothetical protein
MSSEWLLAATYNVVLLGVCGVALLRGGRPERIGASINLLGSYLTTGLRLADSRFNAPAEIVIVVIDLSVTVGFFWLAITTVRFWPIWAFGFAVANISTNVVGAWVPRVPLFAYLTGLGIYAYLALGALLLGTLSLPRSASPWLRHGGRGARLPVETRPTPDPAIDAAVRERPDAQRDN